MAVQGATRMEPKLALEKLLPVWDSSDEDCDNLYHKNFKSCYDNFYDVNTHGIKSMALLQKVLYYKRLRIEKFKEECYNNYVFG